MMNLAILSMYTIHHSILPFFISLSIKLKSFIVNIYYPLLNYNIMSLIKIIYKYEKFLPIKHF